MAAITEAPPAHSADLLAPQALYERVAERLRQQIFARELEPGDWIDEMRLCGQWGISRTPLREALKVLAAEGLVTIKVRRGAYVTEMSREDVAQVYHLLALIESEAAAQVAQQVQAGHQGHLPQLELLHSRLETHATDRDTFFAVNESFHRLLMESAGNQWSLQVADDLRKVLKLSRHHSLLREGRVGDSLQEHRELMRALCAGNPDAARRLMRAHFQNSLLAVPLEASQTQTL